MLVRFCRFLDLLSCDANKGDAMQKQTRFFAFKKCMICLCTNRPKP